MTGKASAAGAARAPCAAGAPRRAEPLLFEVLPEVRGRIPWIPLVEAAAAGTAVEPLARLGARAGVDGLWVKRDDRTSPLYGGNKVRKLEWLLGAARARGRRAVVTLGAWGSHHALATAVFAREAGLAAHLVLYPQPITDHVLQNVRADIGAGARLHCARGFATSPLAWAAAYLAALAGGGGPPHRIPAGGSSAAGTLGYVECGLEIARAVAAGAMPAPDHVYVAAGTCGTLAGLALGLGIGAARIAPQLAGALCHGVRVVPAVITNHRAVRRLARGAARLLRRAGAPPLPPPCRFDIVAGHLGPGYGHPTEDGRAAIEAMRATEGIALEPTYTGKAVAGMLAAAAAAPPGRTHLYVHTLSGADLGPLIEAAGDAPLPAAVARAARRLAAPRGGPAP